MIYAAPQYYRKFKCLADNCPDTCCSKWQISIDDRSLEKYLNATGNEKNRFLNSIDWNKKSFCHYDDKCAFLDENGLCDIQKDKGSEWLCKTCRNYPRHVEEFENVREYSISMSCPEAARLILLEKDFDKFLTRTDNTEEEFEYFDIDLYESLMASRKFILAHILRSDMNIKEKMAYSLLFGYDLQARIDRGRTDLVKKFINKCIRNMNSEKNVEKLSNYICPQNEVLTFRKSITKLFSEIDFTDNEWSNGVLDKIKNLQNMDNKEYVDLEYNFYINNQELLDQVIPAFMAYMVTVYFNGAVYDQDAYAKIKFSCINTLMFMEILKAQSFETGKQLDIDQVVDVAHRLSREIEHTVTNIECIENDLIYGGGLTLHSILVCILE